VEGERKQVTVLFADLKGSMELLADRDPEEARKILDPVLERMIEAVHHYEGTVNQVMGDGIMALFGAPLAHEDHAVRACYAALRMQESVRQYADHVFRSRGLPIQIRVGLNSGEVVVRAIGSDLHMDYTAVGRTTHLAARMEQAATPGSTLITAATLQLVEGYMQVRPLGPVAVRGLADPTEVYELVGARAVRSRLRAAATRGLTPFVGRTSELDQLAGTLDTVGRGHGQVVAIVGEPGVGKSRLVYEVVHSHRTHGWLVVESTSVSYGKATPYLPLIDSLKSYFHVDDRDDARTVREKVGGKIITLDLALLPAIPVFLSLFNVLDDDPQWEALEPAQRRVRTLEACKALVLRESQAQPLVLVFEDLHWIDAETQAFLDSLVESLPTARILLLVNYRPEYQHAWGSKTYYLQLRIDPLPADCADELLATLLGGDPGLALLKRSLIEATEGNPFFLEESIRTLVETRALSGERGVYRLAREVTAIEVAPTVQTVLAARIDRLPAGEKRLLQSAAVIGKDVPVPLLKAIAGLADDELGRQLTHLQAAEFLYETRVSPEAEYTFKHALTHDVAYGSLLGEPRRDLHARIVEAIERLYRGRLAERLEQLAHHAVRGEMWDKAAEYARQAGAQAMSRAANREAAGYLEQALSALQHLSPRAETVAKSIDLRFELRDALWSLGQADMVLGHLREAEALAQGAGDQRRLVRATVYLAHYSYTMDDSPRGPEPLRRARAAASALGDPVLELQADVRLGQVHLAMGDYHQAVAALTRVLRSIEGRPVDERWGMLVPPAVFARTLLLRALAELGDFPEGQPLADEVLRIGEQAGHPYTLIHAWWGAGAFYSRQGVVLRASPLLERAFELCRTAPYPALLPGVAASLAWASTLGGRAAQALALTEAIERGRAGQASRLAVLGEVYLQTGRLADATSCAARALDVARGRQSLGAEAWALRLLGEVATASEPANDAKAADHYRAGLSAASALRMRPLVAHCHLGLGKLYRRTGKREQATEHLTTTTTMYREMDMPYWLEKAETEMRRPA
jgi:class 3 adenylate cyclase/tetratricopeptide (TPR) repeat protein